MTPLETVLKEVRIENDFFRRSKKSGEEKEDKADLEKKKIIFDMRIYETETKYFFV